MKELPPHLQSAIYWPKGNSTADVFEVDGVFEHHWGRTITDGDNMLFSTLTESYNPIYFNEEYAKRDGHAGVVVNPLLVFNTILGLSVEDLSENQGPFVGIKECIYHKTVYAGDTLRATSTVIDKRETISRPGSFIVTWKTLGFNQHDELVVEYVRSNLLIPNFLSPNKQG